MARLVAMMGALLVISVGRSDGTVTLPSRGKEYATGRDPDVACIVTGETFDSWITPSGQRITTSTTGRITVSVTGDAYTLNIDSVTAQDGGEYRCQGSLNSDVFTLNVNYAVKDAVNLKQTLKMGQTGTLLFDVTGYPQLTYEWTKDGQKVTFGRRITLNQLTGSITFNPVQMIDEGNYTCQVISVELGSHTFDPISARVIDSPQINKYQGEPVNRRLSEGYNNTFHCNVTKGTPKPTVTWYFGWVDTSKKVDSQYDSRYSHPTEEEWTITGISAKDKDKYRCIATNEAGEDSLRFEITQVDVPPSIDPLTDITVDEGVNQDLVCKVSGSPPPIVEWLKDGVRYRTQTRSTEGNKVVQTISFTNIRWVNSGRYICKANNGALDSNEKEIVVTQTINLNVNSPPMIDTRLSPTPVYSFIGYQKEVTIACTFSGYPTPMVKMVNMSSGQEVAQGNRSASFKITTDSDNDFGTFNCTAENSLGMKHFLVELKVAETPSVPRNLVPLKTCNSVTLEWEAPKSNGGLEITYYYVRLTDKDNVQLLQQSAEASQRKVEIDYRNFTRETAYTVYLAARNGVGFGQEEMVKVTTKKYCVPGRPAITNKELEVETSFTLTWQAPSDNGGDSNLKYKVEWRKKPITQDTVAMEEDNIGDLSLTIKDLEGPAEYEFKVFAKNSEGSGEPDTKTFTVKQAPTADAEALKDSLSSGAIAGIVIAVILIVLVAIDLFCCFFNSCGLFFCCSQALCGGGSGAKKDDYADGKATELEKKKLAKESDNANV